jgi:hypothetical protein
MIGEAALASWFQDSRFMLAALLRRVGIHGGSGHKSALSEEEIRAARSRTPSSPRAASRMTVQRVLSDVPMG